MNFLKDFFKRVMTIVGLIGQQIDNSSASPEVVTITSFYQALPELGKADNQTIIFFDIDYTLINPRDPMGRYYVIPLWFKVKALLKYPQLLLRKNMEYYYSIIWLHEKWSLTEPEVGEIINNLKSRGYLVLALSSTESDSFGQIHDFPEWHYQLLKKLGIEFCQDFGEIIFKELSPFRKSYPKLYKGIICCNNQPKDIVAQAFLQKINLAPKQIIFFDDRRSNVLAVQSLCSEMNIAYKGFEYYNAPWRNRKWNEERASWQLDYLIRHKKWITDYQYAEMKKNHF